MEIIKNVSAVLSLIVAFGAVVALLSKSVRSFLGHVFARSGGEDVRKDIRVLQEENEQIKQYIEDDTKFREQITNTNDIIMEFVRTQCRNIIKDIYNKYYDVQCLPYYDYKMLLSVEDLYVRRAHSNSFALDMINRMKTWDVDYSQK